MGADAQGWGAEMIDYDMLFMSGIIIFIGACAWEGGCAQGYFKAKEEQKEIER